MKRLHKTEYVVQETDESNLIWVKKWTRQEIDRQVYTFYYNKMEAFWDTDKQKS